MIFRRREPAWGAPSPKSSAAAPSTKRSFALVVVASLLAVTWLLFGGLIASTQGPVFTRYRRLEASLHHHLPSAHYATSGGDAGWLSEPPQEARQLKVYTYVKIPTWGKAFERIHKALLAFKPSWVSFVHNADKADVHVAHVLGAGEVSDIVHPYTVIIQHVTACDLNAAQLVRLWTAAMLVASFHDLDRFVAHHSPQLQHAVRAMNMPWGASPKDFTFAGGKIKKATGDDRYAFITGEKPDMESHREVLLATAKLGMGLKQTGHQPSLGDFCKARPESCGKYEHLRFQSHASFKRLLSEASWVPVLRKHEGFEMMGVEALFSGTRPIVYDLDSLTSPYRWFKGHAALVPPEDSHLPGTVPDDMLAQSAVVHALERVLAEPPKEISREEIQELHRKFSWEVLVPAFYERIWAELHRRTNHGPQPSEPRLAGPLLPRGNWQEAARAALVACLKGDNSTIDRFGRTVADTSTGACPPVVLLLAAEDRSFDNCQDAALLATHLAAHITAPAPLPPSCRPPTYILLTPGAYPPALGPLIAPPDQHAEIWVLHPPTPPPSNPRSNTRLLNAVTINLRRDRPPPTPRASLLDPMALLGSRRRPSVQTALPLLSLDPRDPATAKLPSYSEFLLVVAAGAEPLVHALLAHWAPRPVHPHLHIATTCPQLLAAIAQYRTGTHPSTPYNVTNIHPLDPATLSTPSSLPSLLEFGVHIHAVAPPTPKSPSPAAHPHLANLARSVGATLLLPSYSPALEPLLEGQQAAGDLSPTVIPSVITYSAAGGASRGVEEASGGVGVASPSGAEAPQGDKGTPRGGEGPSEGGEGAPEGRGEAAAATGGLVEAVERVAQLAVWQRMLVGQRGQGAYVMDAERYQRRLKTLAMRSSLYAKEGCAWCGKRMGAPGLWVGPDMGNRRRG